MTINANALVNVTPSVIAPGGSNFAALGLMLTASTRIPIGQVLSFPNPTAVSAYFGTSSAEYGLANIYFQGYTNSSKKPGALLMAQMPYTAAASAFLRSAPTNSGTLAALLALPSAATINLVIDGVTFVSNTVNLTVATSLSNAAGIIQTALQAAAPTASFTATATGKTLTVTAVSNGTIVPGMTLAGPSVAANTVITGYGTGTGGAGTYNISVSQTLSSTAVTGTAAFPTVNFDSVSASFVVTSGQSGTNSSIAYPNNTNLATAAGLTQTQGAALSQGAVQTNGQAIPAYLNTLLQYNRGFAGLMTAFEPILADKVQIATWISPLPNWYAMWDTNIVPTQAGDVSSAGYQIRQANLNGIVPIYLDPNAAAAILGAGASVDYGRRNGRVTLAYLQFAGVTPSVTSDTIAANLLANGYNFYGSYANAGNGFIMFQNGSITGNFAWWDSYTNQIWLNNNIQTSLIQLLQTLGSNPYNPAGYANIRTALYSGAGINTATGTGQQPQTSQAVGPIAQAVTFGAIRQGVVLSANEVAAVNAAAGLAIDGFLNQNGWYLQVLDPGATVRLARGSPIVNLWYMDGQSVQQINVASTDVQ